MKTDLRAKFLVMVTAALGTAGAVLLVTGATFERRRAELRSLHRQLRSLR